ncbi:rhomboid family intramembrane serine protease [Gracilibacillus salitolerans]|uniref:Rhomboid family intramembrane serine protease n=1 Tax=Gracilibacillus salitolerans TaxID=2663022 RepID=A0A5Q2TEC9_9BACI|nr:rhomboid family intramembrane serine protease [Gracilibacillus salitolerans]QGH33114.1 rhomboid family intramembrane serine protease [Gracilibacillus salitolerans]
MFLRTESFRDFLQFYPVVSAIVALQVIIWLIVGLVPGVGDWIYTMGVGWNGMISQGEYWRLITPIFLHAGFGHILFNSFSLILFAPALEQMLGKVKFLVVYFTAGIAANILTYIVEPNPFYTHVGASGAIFGLFGLYLFMVFFEKKLIDPQNARLILIISVIGLVMTFFRANINISGHLFGFVAGFALGPVILKNAQPFSPWKNRRKVRDDDIGFDPNRWNKKRYRYKPYLKPIIFGILIVLVLLGLISGMF